MQKINKNKIVIPLTVWLHIIAYHFLCIYNTCYVHVTYKYT